MGPTQRGSPCTGPWGAPGTDSLACGPGRGEGCRAGGLQALGGAGPHSRSREGPWGSQQRRPGCSGRTDGRREGPESAGAAGAACFLSAGTSLGRTVKSAFLQRSPPLASDFSSLRRLGLLLASSPAQSQPGPLEAAVPRKRLCGAGGPLGAHPHSPRLGVTSPPGPPPALWALHVHMQSSPSWKSECTRQGGLPQPHVTHCGA